jgi:hypothetical protein
MKTAFFNRKAWFGNEGLKTAQENHSSAPMILFGCQITMEPFHFHVSYCGRLL